MSSVKINSINLGPIGTSYTDLNTSIEYINTGLNSWLEQLSTNSFTGGTSGISGSGTINRIPKFNSTSSIVDSNISDNITEIFINSNLEINSAKTISIGSNYVFVDNDILSGGTY
jgi:hypothetical protein